MAMISYAPCQPGALGLRQPLTPCSADSERQPVHSASAVALACDLHQKCEAAAQPDAVGGLEAEQDALELAEPPADHLPHEVSAARSELQGHRAAVCRVDAAAHMPGGGEPVHQARHGRG